MGTLTDYFGVVGRDSFYEFNTNPAFPGQLNQAFLGKQFDNITALGAGWLRFEFHVEYDATPNGTIDYRKLDWFVSEANRRGIKLLGLLGSGIIKNSLRDLNQAADKADGTNPYIRAYVDRCAEIWSRYPGQIAAWEILNEPNVSYELYRETGGKQQEISPERYATLIAKVRRRFDTLGNKAPVLIGGLLKGVPIENPKRYTTDFLESLYTSKPISFYTKSENHYPWDGVCIHPYPDLSNRSVDPAQQVQTFLQQMYGVMTKYKEPGRIWITELGWEAAPMLDNTLPPNQGEQNQLDFMRAVLNRLLNNLSGAIAHLFWFKLEDFSVDGQQYNNWGLVHLKPGSTDLRVFSPGGEALRYKPAFSLYHSYTDYGVAAGTGTATPDVV
jgi:hypothetical protein